MTPMTAAPTMTPARAAILTHAGAPFTVTDVEIGAPGHGEIGVRMVATGLCHTDLGVQAGGVPFPLPGIIGHEGAGIVERLGPGVDGIAVGDKVLLSFTACGDCASCTHGHPAYCGTWGPRNLLGLMRSDDSATIRADGAPIAGHFFGQSSFATYAIADQSSAVVVSPDADLAVLAPLGCGILTGFGSIWNVLDPAPGDSVSVHGTGAVGLAGVIAAARRDPAILIAVDIVDERLDLARELGATHTVNGVKEDVAQRIAEITEGVGVRHAFDTTGHPAVARTALDAAAIGGTVLVCGAPPPGTEIGVDIQGILPGKSLRGVTMGDTRPAELIPQLVDLHTRGLLPLERLERTYALDDIDKAVHDMHHGITVKPVIVY